MRPSSRTPSPSAPILKWMGGKAKIAPTIAALFAEHRHPIAPVTHYVEPFAGAGAVGLHLATSLPHDTEIIFADTCPLLHYWWGALPRRPVAEFHRILSLPAVDGRAGKAGYLTAVERLNAWLRADENAAGWSGGSFGMRLGRGRTAPLDVAATVYTLNKCSFNGIARFNQSGQFNTPWGQSDRARTPPTLEQLAHHAAFLGRATPCADASFAFARLGTTYGHLDRMDGVWIYVDPPYVGTFDGYSPERWSLPALRALRDVLEGYSRRGATVLLSEHAATAEHLPGWTVVHRWQRPGTVSSKGAGRQPVEEAVFLGPRSPA
jgi:site-specific DNA-adenine methylase